MEKIVIHKNKGETIKCHFEVDGADPDDISVRLCLEFEDNKNMFFYGSVAKDGECSIQIPRLNELDNKNGKLIVEAIVDSTYFKMYECLVDLKNSVEVKMKKGLTNQSPIKETSIKLSGINLAEQKQEEAPPPPQPEKNPWIPKNLQTKKTGFEAWKEKHKF